MIVLIEKRTLQAEAHLEHEDAQNLRLRAFLAILEKAAGTPPAFTVPPLSRESLQDVSVLVVPTLLEPYGGEEMEALEGFVSGGGGLWLLSNHHPFFELDGRVTERFGIATEGTFFRTPGSPTLIEEGQLRDHALLDGPGGKVRAIVTNTTCSLRCENAEPLALLPPSMDDKHTGVRAAGAFAYALDGMYGAWEGRRGRLLVTADSGFIGNRESRYPGPGQIEEGDNRAFVENAVLWLAGRY